MLDKHGNCRDQHNLEPNTTSYGVTWDPVYAPVDLSIYKTFVLVEDGTVVYIGKIKHDSEKK
jgi:hypothetical protein